MNIHIPNPCHENREQMQQEAQGRFCAVWSKKLAAIIIVVFGITASACHNKSNEQHTRKYSADNVQLMDGLTPVIKAGLTDSSSYTEDTTNAQTKERPDSLPPDSLKTCRSGILP